MRASRPGVDGADELGQLPVALSPDARRPTAPGVVAAGETPSTRHMLGIGWLAL
jgi:hypothetical protein